jgi:hypothetical protein
MHLNRPERVANVPLRRRPLDHAGRSGSVIRVDPAQLRLAD